MMRLYVYRWSNGNVTVFDVTFGKGGGQVPALQGRYEDVRADVLNAACEGSSFFHGDWASGVEEVTREQW